MWVAPSHSCCFRYHRGYCVMHHRSWVWDWLLNMLYLYSGTASRAQNNRSGWKEACVRPWGAQLKIVRLVLLLCSLSPLRVCHITSQVHNREEDKPGPFHNIIIVRFYSHKRHTATHTWIYGGDTGHTRTRRPEVAVNLRSAFSHPGLSFLQDPRSSG